MSLRLVYSGEPRRRVRTMDDLGAFQGFMLGLVFAIPFWTLMWVAVSALFSLEPLR